MAPVPKPVRARTKHFMKEWRKFRGLTQERLAERIPMSRENYSKIENGKVPYNQDVLEVVADALRCEPGDLIMRDPNSTVWSLVDSLRDVKPERIPELLKIIEIMKQAA